MNRSKLSELVKKLKERNYDLNNLYSSLNKKNKDFIRKTIDLTEIKNQLEDQNFELERVNQENLNLLKTRTEFINRVAHDLRTPLTPIVILIPLIKNKINDESIKHDLTIVENNAKYINQLVNDLITLIKSQSGKFKHNYEKLKLSSLIYEVLENEENVLKAQKIKVIKKIDENCPSVFGDKLGIVEVLQNIISNTIKFTPKKGSLIITTFEKDNFIYISIKDNGIGMTKKTISNLFEPFFKADKSRHAEGSGLGLSICKKIIESHGGGITAQSKGAGKGTTITFYLPITN